MDTIWNYIHIILWIIIGVKINKIYHRIFHVIYFGARGIFKELIVTIGVSGLISAAIVTGIKSII